ncbi:hypothetical protein [Mucilaginibacter lacusdianchii]|uniref:hypothetical protein n=1 Tax=Mucilaginibacter lacusdianchii TaxID=2684211 RepID=UPI00131D1DB4|nr:hypothetical protein [Mucilaginibacter sp. JXJ CY 39]
MLKRLYTIAIAAFVLSSCSSPSKKQHEDKGRRINELQNVGAGATDDASNSSSSSKFTDSTYMKDTTGKK